jgi:hypothetical protein
MSSREVPLTSNGSDCRPVVPSVADRIVSIHVNFVNEHFLRLQLPPAGAISVPTKGAVASSENQARANTAGPQPHRRPELAMWSGRLPAACCMVAVGW